HTATAAEVLGVDPAKLTKGERSIAKMINFGIVYGISAFGLSENLEIPREQAQEYIDAYLARFPHVQDFIARTIEEAARDGYVTSLIGRRRPVPEIRDRKSTRLNSSHRTISYAVFCLKKKKKTTQFINSSIPLSRTDAAGICITISGSSKLFRQKPTTRLYYTYRDYIENFTCHVQHIE